MAWSELGGLVLLVLSLFGQAAERIEGLARPQQSGPPAASDRIPVLAEAMGNDLATRLGVDAADIELESFETVTWPDGCIGVYIPGTVCIQALVPGFLATLAHDGELYRYHGAGHGFVAADFVTGASIEEPLDDARPVRSPVRVIPLEDGPARPGGRGLIR